MSALQLLTIQAGSIRVEDYAEVEDYRYQRFLPAVYAFDNHYTTVTRVGEKPADIGVEWTPIPAITWPYEKAAKLGATIWTAQVLR